MLISMKEAFHSENEKELSSSSSWEEGEELVSVLVFLASRLMMRKQPVLLSRAQDRELSRQTLVRMEIVC